MIVNSDLKIVDFIASMDSKKWTRILLRFNHIGKSIIKCNKKELSYKFLECNWNWTKSKKTNGTKRNGLLASTVSNPEAKQTEGQKTIYLTLFNYLKTFLGKLRKFERLKQLINQKKSLQYKLIWKWRTLVYYNRNFKSCKIS